MTLETPQVGDLFNLRVQSYHVAAPNQKWSNHYSCRVVTETDTAGLLLLAGRLASFHSEMTYAPIVTESVTVSTWLADGDPYNPFSFTVYDANLPGQEVGDAAALLPLEVCLYMRKVVNVGRTGKVFLRGALAEDEVQFGGSLFTFTDAGAINTRLNAAEAGSEISEHYANGGGTTQLCVVSQVGLTVIYRYYLDIASVGVRTVNMNHRYYDRA